MAAVLVTAILRRLKLQSTAWIAATFFILVGVNGAASAAEDLRGQSGIASTYSFNGKQTASGEVSNPENMTAAHRSLPFGTMVRVINKQNGHSVVVRINDRGPFTSGRVIDVTPAAARSLGFYGLAQVSLSVLTGDGLSLDAVTSTGNPM